MLVWSRWSFLSTPLDHPFQLSMLSSPHPLAKLPLLLSAAYFGHLSGTSPQPSPSEIETVKFAKVEKKSKRLVFRFGPGILKFVVISTCLAEAAIILCETYPSFPGSDSIRALFHGTSYSSIYISRTFLVGWALLATGTYLRVTCYRYLGHFFTFELALHADHRLVTSGPYSIVRHPSYSAVLVVAVGLVMLHLSPGSCWDAFGVWRSTVGILCALGWIGVWIVFAAAMVARTTVEDSVLKEAFGKEWEKWAKSTPYRLLPGIY
ncbi:Protein-S-isoprenylcysteine O-methyltransferase B [Grifola frondosa]|uniref:Protein-S-isoprenylcysteine O-methyltransferase n=1 Tax=Grifola frondosa TaxID=5627 RepID=A0A1C7LRU7_GRIFR|nr:Protein-S-isoprenylcysteine O-methyltransferase B [Grifola frondosa]